MPKILKALLFTLCCLAPLAALELPDRHELDERDYRRFTLDNGMKVILVHDPNFNQSAAAVDVAVGALSDPKEHQGLAHFLEHMLFLGTRKYPDAKDYHSYLKTRGGYHNAFTTGNHTNYHLQIHHDAFEGALDRFAQFFIAPLFNPEFSKREVQAVHNEHQRNLMDDGRRQYQLLRQFVDPEHPEKNFSTGNEATLSKVTPEVLRSFYDQHYSANRMALALVSKKSLDWMEAQVREKFSPVPNRKLEPIVYPENFIPKSESLRVLHMKPLKDLKEMSLIFPWPSLDRHFFSQPGSLIGTVLGHEGEGSLLSLLKAKGYATGLSAGPYPNTPNYATFYISVDLTTKGLKEYPKILEMVFGAISHMKGKGFVDHIYEDERHVQQLARVFKFRGEGAGTVTKLSSRLNRYPMDWAELFDFRLEKKDPEAYSSFLSKLTPDRAILLLMDQSLETDQKEAYYGTDFKTFESDELFKLALEAKTPKDFHLPKANPFLAQRAITLPEAPVALVDDARMKVYYQQDTTFRKPKATVISRFKFPTSRVDLDFSTKLSLALRCLNEQLNELTYPARLADLSLSLGGSHLGVSLSISGYDDSLDTLLSQALPKMLSLELNKERFEAIYESTKRGLENFKLSQAAQHVRWASRQYRTETVYTPEQQLSALKKVDYEDIQGFIPQLFKGVYMESLLHGNLSQLTALNFNQRIWDGLKATAMKGVDQVMEQGYLVHPPKQKAWVFKKKLETNNSVLRKDIFLGKDSPRQRVVTRLLANFISEPFFSEMRTRQQLGYYVFASAFNDPSQHYLVCLIQSGTHSADDLSKRANTFVQTLPKLMRELPAEQFQTMKDSIREKLLEKPKSISGKASQLFHLAFNERGNFGQTQQELDSLKLITREECAQILKAALEDGVRPSAEWQFFANTFEGELPNYDEQVKAFRKDQSYWKP